MVEQYQHDGMECQGFERRGAHKRSDDRVEIQRRNYCSLNASRSAQKY